MLPTGGVNTTRLITTSRACALTFITAHGGSRTSHSVTFSVWEEVVVVIVTCINLLHVVVALRNPPDRLHRVHLWPHAYQVWKLEKPKRATPQRTFVWRCSFWTPHKHKKYLEHKKRDRNFGARNQWIENGAPVKRKLLEKQQEWSKVRRLLSMVVQKKSVLRKTHAASNMTWVRKAKAKANMSGTVLLLLDLDHQGEAVKMGKMIQKEKSRREPVHLVERGNRGAKATFKKVHGFIVWLWAPFRRCQSQDEWRLFFWRQICVPSHREQQPVEQEEKRDGHPSSITWDGAPY